MAVEASATATVTDGLKRLFESGAEADFILACGDREWKVHKAVLFLHSDVLYKMSSAGFKETGLGKANLVDDPSLPMSALVHYMYYLDYNVPNDVESTMRFHAGVCQLADKYNVASLKRMAAQKFRTLAETSYRSPDFAQAVDDAYAAEDANRAICLAATDIILNHLELVIPNKLAAAEGSLSAMVLKYATFGADLTTALATKQLLEKTSGEQLYRHCGSISLKMSIPGFGSLRSSSCPSCHEKFSQSQWRQWKLQA